MSREVGEPCFWHFFLIKLVQAPIQDTSHEIYIAVKPDELGSDFKGNVSRVGWKGLLKQRKPGTHAQDSSKRFVKSRSYSTHSESSLTATYDDSGKLDYHPEEADFPICVARDGKQRLRPVREGRVVGAVPSIEKQTVMPEYFSAVRKQ